MPKKAEKMKMAIKKEKIYPCVKYLDPKVEIKNTQKCESPRIPKNYIFPSCFIRPNMLVMTNKHGKLKGKKFQEGECLPLIESSERLRLELENETLPEEEKLDYYELRDLAYGRAEIVKNYSPNYTRDQIFKLEEEKMKQKESTQTIKRQRRTEGPPPPTSPSRRSSRVPPRPRTTFSRGPLSPRKTKNIITFNTLSSFSNEPNSGEYSTVQKKEFFKNNETHKNFKNNKIPKSYKNKPPLPLPRKRKTRTTSISGPKPRPRPRTTSISGPKPKPRPRTTSISGPKPKPRPKHTIQNSSKSRSRSRSTTQKISLNNFNRKKVFRRGAMKKTKKSQSQSLV